MNTLDAHKARLEGEIIATKDRIRQIKESPLPDLKALHLLNEELERNTQLIGMINNHVSCGHQPMWRKK